MNNDNIQKAYASKKQEELAKQQKAKSDKLHNDTLSGTDRIQNAVIKSATAQIEAMSVHEPKVEVKNLTEAVEAINKLNLTNFNTSQPRIADMVDNLSKLSEEMATLSEKFKDIGFAPVSNALTQLLKQIDTLPAKISDISVKVQKDGKEEKLLAKIETAIKSINITPQVSVKAPTVNVPKIDTSKIEDILASSLGKDTEEVGIDLKDYRAQDISENSDCQYVGMLNPKGQWFIMCNDMQENTLRYKFGVDSYLRNFDNAINLNYRLMDEAINEVYSEISA